MELARTGSVSASSPPGAKPIWRRGPISNISRSRTRRRRQRHRAGRERGAPFGGLIHGEDPNRATLRHVGELPRPFEVQPGLHAGRIDPPSRLHRYVLLAVDLEGNRHTVNPRPGAEFPENLAVRGVKGAEVAVVRPAHE